MNDIFSERKGNNKVLWIGLAVVGIIIFYLYVTSGEENNFPVSVEGYREPIKELRYDCSRFGDPDLGEEPYLEMMYKFGFDPLLCGKPYSGGLMVIKTDQIPLILAMLNLSGKNYYEFVRVYFFLTGDSKTATTIVPDLFQGMNITETKEIYKEIEIVNYVSNPRSVTDIESNKTELIYLFKFARFNKNGISISCELENQNQKDRIECIDTIKSIIDKFSD